MKGSMLVTRFSAAVVAVVAGYVSYLHIVDVATRVGERPEVAYALPVTIDALMVMSTLAMLADRRAARRPSAWAQAGFLFGVAVSVTSNVASAAPTWPARGVAAIPAVSLLLAVEVLVRAVNREPATRPVPSVVEDQRDGKAAPVEHAGPVPVPGTVASDHPAEIAGHAVSAPVDPASGGRSRTRPAGARPGPHATGRRRRTSPADRTGRVNGRADRAELEVAARTIHARLTNAGLPLNRQTLTEALRRDGHGVSNAAAGQLLATLRSDQPADRSHNSSGPHPPAADTDR